jgi:hypothetical protein
MLERNVFLIKDHGCGVAELAGIQVDPFTLLRRVTFATAATCDVFLPLRAVPRSWCPLSGLQQDIGVWVGPWRLCHGAGTKFLIKFLITKVPNHKIPNNKVLNNKVPK